MNKKDIFTIILKVLIYILTLLLGAVSASAFMSCSSPDVIKYRGVIILQDTIRVTNYGY